MGYLSFFAIEKEDFMKKTGKKLWIVLAVAVILVGAGALWVNSQIGRDWLVWGGSNLAGHNSWNYTASRRDGNSSMTFNLTEEGLASFNAISTNSRGEILLILTQGSTERTIDISDEFDEYIDLSDFDAGDIHMNLRFLRARDVSVFISW